MAMIDLMNANWQANAKATKRWRAVEELHKIGKHRNGEAEKKGQLQLLSLCNYRDRLLGNHRAARGS